MELPDSWDSAFDSGRDYGLLVMRLGVGLMFFFVHGLAKIQAGPELWAKIGGAMANFGVTFLPAFWGFMAASAECFGGLFLAAGLLARPAAAAMAFTMLVASVMHLSAGDGLKGASHAVELFFVLSGLALAGAGRFSLDRKFFGGKI
ncbi:MAG TPA: DoxX family protein [Elusimicrobiales bacterium]|nr:DoxX family protein [Elusimicrobiales bacterium]